MLNNPQFSLYRGLIRAFAAVSLLATCFASTQSISAQSQPGRRYESTASALPPGSALRETTSGYALTEPADEVTRIEKRAFELTNSVRIENGRTPLDWDAELCRMARGYSEKMARLGFFAHVEPDGSNLRDRARTAGIRYRTIGENIAYNRGFDDPGAYTVQRWMDSSSHRSNLLGREYRASAIGVFVSPEGRVYITQLFITR